MIPIRETEKAGAKMAGGVDEAEERIGVIDPHPETTAGNERVARNEMFQFEDGIRSEPAIGVEEEEDVALGDFDGAVLLSASTEIGYDDLDPKRFRDRAGVVETAGVGDEDFEGIL